MNDLKEGCNKELLNKLKKLKTYNKKDFYKQFSAVNSRLFSDRVIGPEVGVDFQHPFLDRRLVEFLYSIPGEQRWSNAETKHILRKSLVNLLPQSVLSREKKTDHLQLSFDGLKECWPLLFPVLKECRIEFLGYISHMEWEKELVKWRQGMELRQDLWALLTLEVWLYLQERVKK